MCSRKRWNPAFRPGRCTSRDDLRGTRVIERWPGTINRLLVLSLRFLKTPSRGKCSPHTSSFWLADFQSMVDSYEQYMDTNPDAPGRNLETADNAWVVPQEWLRADGLERRVMKRRTMPLRRLNMAEIQRYKSRAAKQLEG